MHTMKITILKTLPIFNLGFVKQTAYTCLQNFISGKEEPNEVH